MVIEENNVSTILTNGKAYANVVPMNSANTNTNTITNPDIQSIEAQMADDMKNAGLVVSVIINLFLFSAWLVIELTDVFNTQIISYLEK